MSALLKIICAKTNRRKNWRRIIRAILLALNLKIYLISCTCVSKHLNCLVTVAPREQQSIKILQMLLQMQLFLLKTSTSTEGEKKSLRKIHAHNK